MPSKILIVDDEAYIRLLLNQTLEDLEEKGVVILTASDGAEALRTVKEQHPVLVFLDVMIPKMDGYDVCLSIKQDVHLSDVVVVMLTAKGQEFDKNLAVQSGADMYLTKPFNPDQIIKIAKDVLGV